MKLLIISLLSFCFFFSSATNSNYGLFIKSYPYKSSEMSSMVLEDGKSFSLRQDLTITFDIYVRNDNVFGNVFRIITDKNENIDLLFTVGDHDKRFPLLVINESVYPLPEEIIREKWETVSITLSPQKKFIKIKYGNAEQHVSYTFNGSKEARISFGICPFENFMTLDVASVNIRDIRIFKGDTLFRFWKLEKHDEDQCYDEVKQIPAIAVNPYWLIDDYISWNKIHEQYFDHSPSVAFDSISGNFYIVNNSEEIHVFNTNNQQSSVIEVEGGTYAVSSPNQLIYIPERKTLLSYNLSENLFSSFSFDNRKWSNNISPEKEQAYWNNSIYYNPSEQVLISFGGYGFYKYNNELIKNYPFSDRPEEKSILADISPRYGTATTLVGNTLYIFGGRGNKSGRQELFPKNFSDFYSINLNTNQVTKLWEDTENRGPEFIAGENLIYDPLRDCFYLFTFQGGGTLLKITTAKAEFIPMSLPVNENVEAQFLYANLHYSSKQNKLFLIMNRTNVNNEAVITIYSLNYPPIPVWELSQEKPVTQAGGRFFIKVMLISLLFLLLAWWLGHKYKVRVKHHNVKKEDIAPDLSGADNSENNLTANEPEEKDAPRYYDLTQSSICLLGGFHVRDKEGKDITSLFTPNLKTLLVLLILYTEENPQGITGKRMLQTVWSNKSENSARNNRNVYLSKLRTLLEQVGDMDIVSENGFWRIVFGNEVKCDYREAMKEFIVVKEIENQTDDNFNKIIELLYRGVLLPNTELDWLDRFKSNFSNLTIDLLSSRLQDTGTISNYLRLKIADTLFRHDFINEEALHTKCKVLSETGKMGLAKSFYDNFCKEYRNLLGSDYQYSLMQVIEGQNLN